MKPSVGVARPARVVSINLVGSPAARDDTTRVRLDLLVAIARAIRRQGWRNLDAIVFPAGFLRSDHWLATLPSSCRRDQIQSSVIGEVATKAAAKLNTTSPNCVLTVGLDTNRHLPWGFRGDQAAAAFNARGCIGVTRKVFPVDGDTNEWGRMPYLLDRQDAEGGERFVLLPNGQRALIAVCYDVFAMSELARGPTGKLRAMRFRTDPSDGWSAMSGPDRWAWMESLKLQIDDHAPRVVLNPIHSFVRPGACLFWQRHGMASASAYLNGALCVGAAQFKSGLPLPHESWLATSDVPARHLGAANHRRSHAKPPLDAFELRVRSYRHPILIRLFQA